MKYDVNDILLWNLPSREEIEKDENIIYEGEHGYLYLKDNPEARIFVFYLDTPQDATAAGKDAMELYLYLFRKYDIFFYSYSYVQEFIKGTNKGIDSNAAEWIGITSFMMELDDLTDEDKSKVKEQREEWLPIYEFYKDLRYRNLISNLYNVTNGILIMHKITGESEISYKDYESLITYMEGEIPPQIKENTWLIEPLNHMCAEVKKYIDIGSIKISKPIDDSIKFKNNDEDDDLPF